jgi:Asp-tRNA(Asn)/Glu-tRNA(Gln) amidotransferase C subunit
MLSEKDFGRLQKLSCIKLTEDEQKKLWDQLINIISFLDQLKELDNNDSLLEDVDYHTLEPLSGTKVYDNIDWLLDNVKHSKVHNAISIKSVLG